MTTKVNAIPDGYHSVTPYLCIDGAAKAIEFYKRAFDAREVLRMGAPGGKVGHAEIEIGGCRIMLADEFPEIGFTGPRAHNGSPVHIHLYVDDVDAVYNLAVAAGATVKRPIVDEFYGDRIGTLEDPFGHTWHVATHKEDVSEDEMARRAAARKSGSQS